MPIDYGPPQGPSRHVMTMAQIKKDGSTGPKIYMYEDNPGAYFDAHGHEVPAVIAKQAGYDIESMESRKSLYSERKRLMERYDQMTGPKPPRVVEDVRPNGHQLVRIGPDVYHIEDKFGERITSAPMSRYYAAIWLDDLDPADPDFVPEKKAPPSEEAVDWDELEELPPLEFKKAKKDGSDEGTIGSTD